jgi:hypothetical protein
MQVAKIPAAATPSPAASAAARPPGVQRRRGGVSARLDAAAGRLARLESFLEARCRETDAGLAAIAATLAAAAAAEPPPPPVTTGATVGVASGGAVRRQGAGVAAEGVVSPYAAAQSPVVAGGYGTAPLNSRDWPAGGSEPLAAPRGPLAGEHAADDLRASTTWSRVGSRAGLQEDEGRRLYITGVRHHAQGPVLMTLDLHDLRGSVETVDSEAAFV